ncbi:MAG: alpha/beta fold hydrolase [Desulfovibrionaceae bacterium]|nr:alpha/beta fold hydrolase [Desulfovibrionaceae bacterium]
MRTLLARTAAVAAGAYLCVLAFLYLTQQSQVFPSKAADNALDAAVRERFPDMRALSLPTPDGSVLSGWLLARPDAAQDAPAPLVLYFGGNADLCSQFLLDAPRELPGFSIAAFDYRGYGRSTGVPSETALKADALLLYDRLTAAGGARKTIVMGRSLGTALAAHVAANREAAAVILVTPFDSIRAVGQQRHPFIPVGLLLKNPFDVLPDAAQIYAPALVLIAARDTTVPPEHARRLAEALRGQEKTVVLDGDHASILKKTEYWPSIRDFLRENGAGPR